MNKLSDNDTVTFEGTIVGENLVLFNIIGIAKGFTGGMESYYSKLYNSSTIGRHISSNVLGVNGLDK